MMRKWKMSHCDCASARECTTHILCSTDFYDEIFSGGILNLSIKTKRAGNVESKHRSSGGFHEKRRYKCV